MNSHGQQNAKHSAIVWIWGYGSPGVDKVRLACMEKRTLWAKVL